jgi:hypothetical protein
MALDIHRLDNGEHIFGLSDYENGYSSVDIIFAKFAKRTGIAIDWYADTILDANNLKFLMQLIDEYVKDTDLNKNKNATTAILGFRGILDMLVNKEIPVKLVGD